MGTRRLSAVGQGESTYHRPRRFRAPTAGRGGVRSSRRTGGFRGPTGSRWRGFALTPGGCQIGYTDHTGCHQIRGLI
jgi:hypothetical protein